MNTNSKKEKIDWSIGGDVPVGFDFLVIIIVAFLFLIIYNTCQPPTKAKTVVNKDQNVQASVARKAE